MNVNDELTCVCEDEYLRQVEGDLRRKLYQWRHMRGDMVLDRFYGVPVCATPVGCYADYGIKSQEEHAECNSFESILESEEDIQQITCPEVSVDWDETNRRLAKVNEIFGDLLPAEIHRIPHKWATPWDVMIRWYGIEKLYMDMFDRPEYIHKLLTRFMKIQHEILDKQEAQGVLDPGNGNYRVGSGGLGITSDLPPVPAGAHATAANMWGCGNAQIFSEVSPEMHWEFSLQYEKPYMERHGLTYYGCCEPLHKKMDILKRINNLRKISMSPWIDIDEAVEGVQQEYVFSFKPNPAMLAGESWNPEVVRSYLQEVLKKTDGCHVELILKDIHTVKGEPHRLWEWESIAMDLLEAR
jgi:hypothetical protein